MAKVGHILPGAPVDIEAPKMSKPARRNSKKLTTTDVENSPID